MATFTSDKAVSTVPARYLHAGAVTEVCTYTHSALASSGDVLQLIKVDPGAIVTAIVVKSTDTAVKIEIGDGVDPNRYLATTAAGNTENVALVNLGYEYSAADTVDITFGTSAATTAAVVQAIVTVVYDN